MNRFSSCRHSEYDIYTDISVTITGSVNWTQDVICVLIIEVHYSEKLVVYCFILRSTSTSVLGQFGSWPLLFIKGPK